MHTVLQQTSIMLVLNVERLVAKEMLDILLCLKLLSIQSGYKFAIQNYILVSCGYHAVYCKFQTLIYVINPLSCAAAPQCTRFYYFTLSNDKRFYSSRGSRVHATVALIDWVIDYMLVCLVNPLNCIAPQ
jgi:hypothetical protein